MGFLSRKPKPAPVLVEEPHPIVEELQRMEEAVPERSVAESDAPESAAPAPTSDESFIETDFAPEAEEEPRIEEPHGEAVAETITRVAEPAPAPPAEPEQPARFMPRDLLAPSRLDPVGEAAEPEVPVKQPDVIAFANQKGGVAKTTTTLNLAVAFAESGYRVLCIDLDPQAT